MAEPMPQVRANMSARTIKNLLRIREYLSNEGKKKKGTANESQSLFGLGTRVDVQGRIVPLTDSAWKQWQRRPSAQESWPRRRDSSHGLPSSCFLPAACRIRN